MNEPLYVARREHKLKQSDLAKKLHISKQTYYRKENGITEFTQKEMLKLAKIFNCTLDDLFGEDERYERLQPVANTNKATV